MSGADLVNTCPSCGAEESLDALLMRMIDDAEARGLIADVIATSLPLGNLVVRYLRLHKPLKQRLRMTTAKKLLAELVPDVQRNVIERKGRLWAVGLDGWKAAFTAVFDARDKGTLTLPLEGNAYLYEVLMRMADKGEAQAERLTEQDRQHRSSQGTVTVKGQTMGIGQALEQVYGGRDPVHAKLDADAKNAAPMPDSNREYIASLRKRIATQTEQNNEPQ